MATENTVTIVGNLVDDPELRYTPNGAAVANFRVAQTQRVKDGDSWKDGETSFFRVNIWRDYAEHVADGLSKGHRVIVIGRLKTRSWETPEGDKRTVTEIDADEVAPSLKWATVKVERTGSGGNGGSRSQGQPGWRQPESTPTRGGEFGDPAPF
jgi:single-strand DNA-binding protein